MFFKKLELRHWQQFEKIDLDIHDRLTILTGSNGSGKTTILNIFAKHFGWNHFSLSTPIQEKNTGIIKFVSRLFNGIDKSTESVIGKITYSNNQSCDLTISDSNSAQYHLNIQSQQHISCFYIPSHRPIFRYQPIGNIPTIKKIR
ncbi:AAA family ATPase [Aquirhabdus sp.]|uniref:AAA family ATPase n=1 Tax=Aquirhabdus sp. TaxID=2824160 RepID=UPI00396C5B18